MPELPDIQIYLEHLERRISGVELEQVRLASPFLLRTVEPGLDQVAGRIVTGLRRMGKRIVIELDGELFLVIHLMISGRLRWREKGAKIPGRLGLAAFDFGSGTLILTEASKKKRASLHVVAGEAGLDALDPGGLEVLDASPDSFRAALTRENRTLKRALTDPHVFSGIGNAFSDEILHAARLTPVKLTSRLDEAEIQTLHEACVGQLRKWIQILREEAGERFPEKVTAIRKGMAVHGKFEEPCPVCGSKVQRILYAANEANYCATCQTGGKLLADRVLSKLMKKDWPRTLEELEIRRGLKPDGDEGGP